VVTCILVLIVTINYNTLSRDNWLRIIKLDIFATMNTNLMGIINSIIYGLNNNLREEYIKYLNKKK